jgi:hypothetical protein
MLQMDRLFTAGVPETCGRYLILPTLVDHIQMLHFLYPLNSMGVAELAQGTEYHFPLDGYTKPKFRRTGSGAFLPRAHADQLLGSLLRCMNDPTYGEPTLF